jgi:copper transport protein
VSARTATRAAVTFGVAAIAFLATAGPAAAHTELRESSPAAGATVQGLDRIELRFTEPIEVSLSHVWIGDTAGYLELAGPSAIGDDPASLTVSVPPLGEGDYEIAWHVVAADGDPVQGAYRMTIAAAPAAATATTLDPAADYPPDTSLAIPLDSVAGLGARPSVADHGHGPGKRTTAVARGLLDLSLAVLIGGLVFLAVVWPQAHRLLRARQVLWGSGGLAAIASLELTAFQHASATGLSTFAALSPAQQVGALQFHFGRVGALRVALIGAVLVLLAALVRRPRRSTPTLPWAAIAVGLALALAQTMALLGQSAPVVSRDGIARLTHVVGISGWIGGLVMLVAVALPRRRAGELVALLPRFSAFATGAVVVLLLGGVVLAFDHLTSVGDLTGTSYGRVLLAKLVVVALALIAAAMSRAHVREALRAPVAVDGAALARPLLLWAGVEVGLLVAVIANTSVLVARVPPT